MARQLNDLINCTLAELADEMRAAGVTRLSLQGSVVELGREPLRAIEEPAETFEQRQAREHDERQRLERTLFRSAG